MPKFSTGTRRHINPTSDVFLRVDCVWGGGQDSRTSAWYATYFMGVHSFTDSLQHDVIKHRGIAQETKNRPADRKMGASHSLRARTHVYARNEQIVQV